MKYLSQFSIVSIVCMGFLFASCQDDNLLQNTPTEADNQGPIDTREHNSVKQKFGPKGVIEGEYIVTFENQFDNQINEQAAQQADRLRQEVLSDQDIREEFVISRYRYALKGFAAKLDTNQVEALRKDPRIARVTPNTLMKLGVTNREKEKKTTSKSMIHNHIVPWGVTRVGGPFDGTGKKAWIIDSGIDLDHADLNVDLANSTSFIDGEDADDLDGHGTHVAGIVAAIDNDQDVVGVAAGASVVPVKVCEHDPPQGVDPCALNNVLAGIDYVSINAQPEDVINISIWGSINNDLDDAVKNAASTGLRFTLIAGNADDDASDYSPGRTGQHSWIWTTSAFDDTDDFADFSNFNDPPIDFSGPGVDVTSLDNGGGTAVMSGTSMAAPHMAGILLNQGTRTTPDQNDNPVPTDGAVTGDPDGNPDQIAVGSDLEVSISGPSFVSNGQQGNWTGGASGGDSPYSYTWYRSTTSPSFWQQVGTGSSYSETVTQSFDLKVRGADDDGTIVTSNVFPVATN